MNRAFGLRDRLGGRIKGSLWKRDDAGERKEEEEKGQKDKTEEEELEEHNTDTSDDIPDIKKVD
ncbi:hypothetical protein TWF694_008218 [Orbilia ellipsospora]|uniref:Uncharacterized protein n=1 Tax=Orbilia ellipsospora TaxID=2528407 RepID=A0AAV9XGY4_9PEZI